MIPCISRRGLSGVFGLLRLLVERENILTKDFAINKNLHLEMVSPGFISTTLTPFTICSDRLSRPVGTGNVGKMHGDDRIRLQQIARICGLARAPWCNDHQWAAWRFPGRSVANDSHVSEHVCVSGVITLDAVIELDDITAGFAAINVTGRHPEFRTVVASTMVILMSSTCCGAAFVHFGKLFHAFLAQPTAELGNDDNFGIVFLSNFDWSPMWSPWPWVHNMTSTAFTSFSFVGDMLDFPLSRDRSGWSFPLEFECGRLRVRAR